MPRKARLDSPGTLHHVIIRGIERRPIVDDEKDRETINSLVMVFLACLYCGFVFVLARLILPFMYLTISRVRQKA